MKPTHLRRPSSVRLLGLALGSAAFVLIPSVALGADSSSPTVRAVIGSDGSVKSVQQYAVDGSSSAFSGKLPITLTINRSTSGGTTTYTYHVENTTSQTQTIHYTDTTGKERHSSTTVQLPLVAQLGVDVPGSMGDITATGATITTSTDRTRHVLWNMVLFSPLGSPAQDVTFTATGAGNPVVQMRATTVDPSQTPGLSVAGQDAAANFQQDDFWTGYAGGGNDGLTQLSAGTGAMIDGLTQLLSGLEAGVDGANQLAAGSADAHAGSQDLSTGIGQIHDGQAALTAGLGKIHTGQGDLTSGLGKIHTGQGDLTGGLVQINAGQTTLTAGLGQISGGLAALNDPTTGLPAAIPGIQALIAGVGDDATSGTLLNGVAQLLAGIGNDATSGTLLNGVVQVQGGLAQLQTGIQLSAGCAVDILNKVITGFAGGADACATGGVLPPLPGLALDPFSAAVLNGLIAQFTAVANGTDPTLTGAFGALNGGLTQIHTGLLGVKGGLSTGDFSNPGIKEGLQLTKGGLQQLEAGVQQAVDGIALLAPGAADAFSGSQLLSAGDAAALDGSRKLTAGSADALAGSKKLTAGSGDALDGSQKLTAGSAKAFDGSKELTDGLQQIADGNQQVADGLPPAVDGVTQLRDGAVQVKDGIDQVQSGAVEPLLNQLSQASVNAHQKIAVIEASAALGATAPGGANATYVLSQNDRDFALAADTSDDSNTARNVGIGLGGLVLLVAGVLGGFALGRQQRGANA